MVCLVVVISNYIVEKIFELFWRDARLSFLSKRGFSMPAKFPKVSMRNLE